MFDSQSPVSVGTVFMESSLVMARKDLELTEKFVPDTSIIIDGKVPSIIEKEGLGDVEIIIPPRGPR